MTGVESLISMHRKEMSLLREEARQARKNRNDSAREMDHAFNELRNQLSAEMPGPVSSPKFRGAIAFMVALLGVLTY
jgi:LPS O-antigen subunit length determinant protein (WzzB/FepE family)